MHADAPVDAPVLVLPVGWQPRGYALKGRLALLEVAAMTLQAEVWVEQVPWSRADTLARVWCSAVGAYGWEETLARDLAQTMQVQPDLLAYLAFEGDAATGMMLVSSSERFSGLWAGTRAATDALLQRGRLEFSGFAVSANPSQLDAVPTSSVVGELEVWVSSPRG